MGHRSRVSKTALGRGLGQLLDPPPESTETPERNGSPETLAPRLTLRIEAASPGLGSLLRGGARQEKTVTEALETAPPASPAPTSTKAPLVQAVTHALPDTGSARRVPAWLWRAVLLVGDGLLVVLAALRVFELPGPMTWLGWCLCFAALMAGACLACLALLMKEKSL